MSDYPINANDRFFSATVIVPGQTVFSPDFLLLTDAEVEVKRIRAGVETILVLTTNYTISGLNVTAGFTCTLTAGALVGDVYEFRGVTALARQSGYPFQQGLSTPALNADMDRALLRDQELARDTTEGADNVGAGTGVFKEKTSKRLKFKTLIAGANILFDNLSDTITIKATGSSGGFGDVANLSPATDLAVAIFQGSTGKLIQDSGKVIGAANGIATLDINAKLTSSQLPASVVGALNYQGTWNATTNTPTIPAASSANKGWFYKTAVAGTTNIDGIAEWAIGDWIVSNGTTWDKIDNTDQVTSVAGKQGAVTLVKGDVGLGNVDNTSDVNKPVSTATQTALDAKEPLGEYSNVNDQTGTTYTFGLTDKGRLVSGSNAGAITWTVPTNATAAFPVKSRIDIWQKGAGQITIAAAGGVTIRSSGGKLKLTGQYSAAILVKIATDEWLLVGDIAT